MNARCKHVPTIFTDTGIALTTCQAVEAYYSTLSKSALEHEISLVNQGGQVRIELKTDGKLRFEKYNPYFDEGNDFSIEDREQSVTDDIPFYEHLLIDGVREFAVDTAYRMNNAPLEFAAVSTLLVLSSAIGRRVMVRPKIHDDYTIVPNLSGALIGPPSVKKTPIYTEAIKPLMKMERRRYEEYQNDFAEYRAQMIEYKSALKGLEKTSSENKTVTLPEEPAEPIRMRYVTQDATTEALSQIMIDNPYGILNTVDELSGFLASLNKPGREGDRAFYLEAFSGNNGKSIDRVGRGSHFVPQVCASVFGTIQPDKIAPLIQSTKNGISGGDGLLQRFQLLVMVTKPRFSYVDKKPDQKAINEYTELVHTLLKTDAKEFGAQYDELRDEVYFRFSIEANELYSDWIELNAEKIRTLADENPALAAHLGKFDGLFASIALILFYADKVRGKVNETAITDTYALMAWEWCDFLELHARRIYNIERITEERSIAIEEKLINKVRELERNGELPLAYGKIAGKVRGVNADQCKKILKGAVIEKHKKVFGLI